MPLLNSYGPKVYFISTSLKKEGVDESSECLDIGWLQTPKTHHIRLIDCYED